VETFVTPAATLVGAPSRSCKMVMLRWLLQARFWVRRQVVNVFLLDTSAEVSAAALA